jgi:rhodanese-related sulfurtransferase
MKFSKPARLAMWSAFGVSAALALWWFADHRRGLKWAMRVVANRFPDVPQLSSGILAEWLADPDRTAPKLLDARSAEEHAVSHLPGATRVGPETSDAGLSALVPTDRPVVVYCSAGYRASQLARRLRRLGHRDVANLSGGIFQWANEGREVHRDRVTTREVHPFKRIFSRLLRPDRRPR